MILKWLLYPFTKRLNYYKSIEELPVYNWFKIQETNDLRHILKKYGEVSKKELFELEKAITSLTDQYIDTFGISYEFRQQLELKRDIRVMEIDFFLTQDKFKLTFINHKKAQLKVLVTRINKAETGNVKVYVSKYMGFQVDYKKMSVREFYETLREITNEAKLKAKA